MSCVWCMACKARTRTRLVRCESRYGRGIVIVLDWFDLMWAVVSLLGHWLPFRSAISSTECFWTEVDRQWLIVILGDNRSYTSTTLGWQVIIVAQRSWLLHGWPYFHVSLSCQADFPLPSPPIPGAACLWNWIEFESKRTYLESTMSWGLESSVNLLTLQGITNHVLVQPRTELVLSMHIILCGGYSLW